MNEQQFKEDFKKRRLQEKADQLFVACLQFLISKEEVFLGTIRNLSQELLDEGYETNFEHRKRALLIRKMFTNLSLQLTEQDADRLLPRTDDIERLSDVK